MPAPMRPPPITVTWLTARVQAWAVVARARAANILIPNGKQVGVIIGWSVSRDWNTVL